MEEEPQGGQPLVDVSSFQNVEHNGSAMEESGASFLQTMNVDFSFLRFLILYIPLF